MIGKSIDFNEFGYPPVASEFNTRIELNNDCGNWMNKSQEQSSCKSQEQSNFLISSFVVILFATSLPGVLTRSDANKMFRNLDQERETNKDEDNGNIQDQDTAKDTKTETTDSEWIFWWAPYTTCGPQWAPKSPLGIVENKERSRE